MRQSTKDAMMLERADRFDEAMKSEPPKGSSLGDQIQWLARVQAEGMILSSFVRTCCTPKRPRR